MKKLITSAMLAGAAMIGGSAGAATLVSASQDTPTLIGTFGPGTYQLTGSGVIDLVGVVGSGFDMNPDGTPNGPVTTPPYDAYFNPSGSYTADGSFGPGGNIAKIGALMGTFTATPSAPTDFFLIGYGETLVLTSPMTLYAEVNDTFYSNNGGAYSVSVSGAVPEASSWAMMIAGLGMVGATLRRRRRFSAQA